MNVLETVTFSCLVEGQGDTQAQALEAAFHQLRIEASKMVDGSIISMNALEVEVQSQDRKTRTERFLYLFLPRESITWVLHLNIKVEVKYINLKED